VKIKATRSVGCLNFSSIHCSDYRGKTQSSGTKLLVACGHVHLATSLSHVNQAVIEKFSADFQLKLEESLLFS